MKSERLLTALILGLGLTLGLLWMLGVGPRSVARVAGFTATKFTDDNGTCTMNDCSLREAIIAANAAADPDTITLGIGTYNLTITGNDNIAILGDLDITNPLTIIGAGPQVTIIDASGLSDRVFHIISGTVVISGVTVRNGDVSDSDGGSILNEANLTLINTAVISNTARRGNGGGIYNLNGTVTLINCTISNNRAQFAPDTIGGGIYNSSGTVTLNNSTISNNNAAHVGTDGIYNDDGLMTLTNSIIIGFGIANGGTMTLTNSTVSGSIGNGSGTVTLNNSTVISSIVWFQVGDFGIGGGIDNGSGTVTLNNSTISNNMNRGIYNSSGTVTLKNSTVSSNVAIGPGGGIYNASGTVTLKNSTVSNNTTDGSGGGIYNASGTVTLTNTIVADQLSGGDCSGSIISNGHNLDSDGSCSLGATGDLTADPMLDLLRNNGGSTETHAILPGSPAIDAADNSSCPATDQRGRPRPVDGDDDGFTACDIGAFELQKKIYLPLVLKN